MRTEDGSIIYECLNGKPEAFGVLVDKYKTGIYAYVYAQLRNFQDAQDVTQEVFIQAYRDLCSLRRWESFAFWLYRIASTRCKKWLRARSRRPDRDFIEDQDPIVLDKPSLNAYRDGRIDESLREALDSLPEAYQEVLLLHYFGGMTSRDIGRALGTSPAAILQRLTRARSQLKEEMVGMINKAFEERGLPLTFTFNVVEITKRVKIQPLPRTAGLPWGISLATGIIIAVLSIGSYLNLPELFPLAANPVQTYEAEMPEFGEMPVEMLRMSRMSFPFGRQGDSYDSGLQLPEQQNAVLMAPRGEGGEFPEEPSARIGKGSLGGIVYSPDGKLLAAAGGLGIWLYDASDLSEIALFGEGLYSIIAFSPDGKILAVSDQDYCIHLWDVNEQKQAGILGQHTSSISSIAFSPDGKTLASGSYDKTILLWDIQGQKRIGVLQGHTDGVRSIAFSLDGKVLASGSSDKTIRLWDVQEQEQVGLLQGHTSYVPAIALSPDGKTLASGSNDMTIRLWNIQNQEQIGILRGHTDWIPSIAFSIDGRTLASVSGDKTIRLWDVKEQKQTGIIKGFMNYPYPASLTFSPDSMTLAIVDYDMIRLCDVQEQKQTAAVEGFTELPFSLNFSPDGKTLASGIIDRTIRLWDVQEGKQTGLLEGYVPLTTGRVSVAFSPGGKTIAAVYGTEIYLFDVQKPPRPMGTLRGHTQRVSSIAFTPDGRILASAGYQEKTVRLWDMTKLMDNQKQIGVLWNGSWTHCLSISPDGETLAVSVGDEKLVRLWDIPTQRAIGILQDTCAAWSVAINPDGKTVASCNQCGEIRLWNMETQEQIGMLQGHISGAHLIFSPDGKWLCSVGSTNADGVQDLTTRIWDVQKQEQMATIEGHYRVNAAAFSPGGKWLATAGREGTILLWEVNLTIPGQSVEPTGKLPGTWGGVKKTELLQNFPNPFNPETWIPYQLSKDSSVVIKIQTSSGQLVRTLDLGDKPAGFYTDKTKAAYWDGTNESGESVASGVYFYTIQTADKYTATKKMVIER